MRKHSCTCRKDSGEPETVDKAMRYCRSRIHYTDFYRGMVNTDAEDYIKDKLLVAIFKYRFKYRQDT